MKKRIILPLTMVALFSFACKLPLAGDSTITISRSDEKINQSPLPDRTSIPSTATQTPTPTSTPVPLHLAASIFGVDWLPTGDLLITIQTEEPVLEDYFLLEGENIYNCRISQDSEYLLFCVGKDAFPGRETRVDLLELETNQIVYTDRIQVPLQPTSPESSGGSAGLTQVPTLPPGPTTVP